MQLDLFEDETVVLQEEVRKLRESLNAVRKGLFARHNDLAKMYVELKNDMDNVKIYTGYKKSTDIINLLQEVV